MKPISGLVVLAGIFFIHTMGHAGELMPSVPPQTQCVISVSNNNIHYGQLSRWQLEKASTASNLLTPGKRAVSATISCPVPQIIRVRLRGDATVSESFRYGDKGVLSIRLINAWRDGQTFTPDYIASGEQRTVTSPPPLKIRPGDIVTSGGGNPVRSLTLQFDIEPHLPESAARVSARTETEGRFVLTLE